MDARAATGVAIAAASGALLLGTGCRSNPPISESSAAVRQPARVTDAAATTQPAHEAQAWWKRTQEAQRTIPVRASVVVTRFHDGGVPPTISRYDMVEGAGGRKYRITYHAPASASGRIVLSDGTTLWQYEPDHDTVLRRPAPVLGSGFVASVAGETGAAGETQKEVAPRETDGVLRLEPDADSVAGRPTRVLALLAAPNGAVVERRWIDTKTGRALRTERYDISGKPWRRVEMTQVAFSPVVSESEFVASIASGTRVIDTNHPALRKRRKPRPDAEAAARHVHLAAQARDFVLDTATKHPGLSGANSGAAGTTHLTYTNGTSAISVFVTPTGNSKSEAAILQGASGWKSATFPAQKGAAPRAAWTQETRTQSAVAWTQNHNRLIAVAQMPVRDLLPVAGTLASNAPQSESSQRTGKTPDK